ncbi:MAG: hypothetical protein R2880_08130 [Deinococcales bacterium]
MSELIEALSLVQQRFEPEFKGLKSLTAALAQAKKLASQDKLDASAMQKALVKFEQGAQPFEDEGLKEALNLFKAKTEELLEALAFDFAKDLKDSFQAKGIEIEGRPPSLVVGELLLEINMASRKALWFYGKEPLSRPLALSLSSISQAYEAARKLVLERKLTPPTFSQELFQVYNQELAKRSRRPTGGRLPILEIYSQMVLARQSSRFWNTPSRATFVDYPRVLFVRDLVLSQGHRQVSHEGSHQLWHLHGATKSQAESASRSLWLPSSALEGAYYADISFEEA